MRSSRLRSRLALLALVTGAASAASGCASDAVDASDFIHVHGLIVDEGAPTYVVAHTGLFEVLDGRTVRVDDAVDDLMAATRSDAGELLASGHPQLGDERLRVPGTPPLLGLVVRADDTWQPRSLLGEADFHALVATGDTVLGADGTSASVLASRDAGRTWEPRGRIELVAMAIDPDDTDNLAGVTYEGTIVISGDGARTWEELPGVAGALDVAWAPEGPAVLSESGTVWEVIGDRLEQRGDLAGAAAITSDGGDLFALVPPAGLWTSVDGGETWERHR